MADTSLWPVVVGGLLALGGTVAGAIATTIRDAAQQRHETRKRRADKFEELVAAVYEFDHWLEGIRNRNVFGIGNGPERVTPFAKVQSISSVYFPQFSDLVRELERASSQYMIWIHEAAQKRLTNYIANLNEGSKEVIGPYLQKREALLDALKKFAHAEFQ
jgi:hypothetical protein